MMRSPQALGHTLQVQPHQHHQQMSTQQEFSRSPNHQQQQQHQQQHSPNPNHSLSPPPASFTSSSNPSFGSGSASSAGVGASPTSSSSPSISPDPLHSRAHDPTRIQALIQVVYQLTESGIQHKFLSQLGIVFKQLHPHLFVKGILKELVDHAVHCGLLTISGPPGQQQVELTATGGSIAKTWRVNHEAQNQREIQSMKETLQLYQNQQFDVSPQPASALGSSSSWSGAANPTLTNQSSMPQTPTGFSFLDEHEVNFPNRGTQSLNNTGGSSLHNTGGSSLHQTGTSSVVGGGMESRRSSSGGSGNNSVNNTGGSSFSHHAHNNTMADERDPINTTSGKYPKDTNRIDFTNFFGPTTTSIFGVTESDDSDILASYQEQEAARDRFRNSKSPANDDQQQQQHQQHQQQQSQQHHFSLNNYNNNPPSNNMNLYNQYSSGTNGSGGSSFSNNRQPDSASSSPFLSNSYPSPGSSTSASGQYQQPQQQHIINGGNIHSFIGATPPPLTNSSAPIPASLSDTGVTDPSALQLLPPLPTSLELKTFRSEKIKHLKYLFHFRVHPCLNYLQKGSCPFDNKNECFDYHSLKTRRRIPRIYQFSNGIFWSYNACRCQAIEKEQRCEKGEGCRYAHCKEEIAYHPSRYKSAPCSYPLRPDGSCSRFGLHCAFSHGEHDSRKPIVLKQGMPHKLVEPTLQMLQDQQQRMAEITGLQLSELNLFSMSGQNNSMSFGANSGTSSNTGSTNTTSYSHGAPPTHNGSTNGLAMHHASISWDASAASGQLHQLQSTAGMHATDSPPMHFANGQRSASVGGGLSSHAVSSPSLLGSAGGSTDLSYGTAPNSPSLHSLNLDPSYLASLDMTQYQCPPDELHADREYFLYTYKTLPCRNQTLACTRGECPSYHYENKRRRNPRLHRYNQEPCIIVKPPQPHGTADPGASAWRRASACRLGDSCEFSHTMLESMYHPMVYKTRLCAAFNEHDRSTWQRCPWKRACSHAHGRVEQEYAEACVRDLLAIQQQASGNRNSISNTGGNAIASAQNADARYPWSAPIAPAPRSLFYDAAPPPQSSSSSSSSTSTTIATTHPYHDANNSTPDNADNALPGISSDGTPLQFPSHRRIASGQLSAFSREFVPSPPLTAHTAPTAASNALDSDQSMRNVLLKQDTAARILRMQQQQLGQQSSAAAAAAAQANTQSSSNSSFPPPLSSSSNSLVEHLRSENLHLLDRLSRFEKELFLLKHKVDEKDATIQQMQWTIERDQEEKSRMKTQFDSYRQEMTHRLIQQQQQHHAHDRIFQQQQQQQHHQHLHQQQQQQHHHVSPPPASSSSNSSFPSSIHTSNLPSPLHTDDSHEMASQMAESILISTPHTD